MTDEPITMKHEEIRTEPEPITQFAGRIVGLRWRGALLEQGKMMVTTKGNAILGHHVEWERVPAVPFDVDDQ